MIDKDQIIKAQQEKIERIEQLQEELHKLSMLGLLTVKFLDLPDELKLSKRLLRKIWQKMRRMNNVSKIERIFWVR